MSLEQMKSPNGSNRQGLESANTILKVDSSHCLKIKTV